MTDRPAYRRYRQVADRLAQRIVGGEIPPGARLPSERDLAAELTVSRPTLREALIALELMGYVEVRGGSGVYVRRPEGDRRTADIGPGAFEVLEARKIIEADVAGIAAATITPEILVELRDCVLEMLTAYEKGDVPDDADRRFHVTIARATDNGVLLAVVEQLWAYRAQSNTFQVLEKRAGWDNLRYIAIEDHVAILKALEAHDAAAARAAMTRHITHNIDLLLDSGTETPAVSSRDRRSKLRLLIDRPHGEGES